MAKFLIQTQKIFTEFEAKIVPRSHGIWHNYRIEDGPGPGMEAGTMSFVFEQVVPIATWIRMSEKAEREGLKAFRINDDRRSWVVTSYSHDGVAYEVTILDGDLLCSCRGSSFHPYCKHRALVLQELGVLDDEDADGPLVPDHVKTALSAA